MVDDTELEQGRVYRCPNCHQPGYHCGHDETGALRECGNANCQVYLWEVSELAE